MVWHFFFESLGYIVAFRIYLSQRQKAGDFLPDAIRWTIVAAAIAGAAIGSKVVYWLEDPARTLHQWNDLRYLLAGKTILGALLGGTAAVEIVKSRSGIRRRTGDLFAVPIAIGIAIGRIGCFLAGKQDDTYGSATSLPWGVNLGDGVRRHPVQLYEAAFMLVLAIILVRIRSPRFAEGDRFRLFLLAYYSWRLSVDFLKPGVRFGSMSMLQWVCMAALIWYLPDLFRIVSESLRRKEVLLRG